MIKLIKNNGKKVKNEKLKQCDVCVYIIHGPLLAYKLFISLESCVSFWCAVHL